MFYVPWQLKYSNTTVNAFHIPINFTIVLLWCNRRLNHDKDVALHRIDKYR